MCLFDSTVHISNKEAFVLFIGTINTPAKAPPLQTALYKPKPMRKNSISWWTILAEHLVCAKERSNLHEKRAAHRVRYINLLCWLGFSLRSSAQVSACSTSQKINQMAKWLTTKWLFLLFPTTTSTLRSGELIWNYLCTALSYDGSDGADGSNTALLFYVLNYNKCESWALKRIGSAAENGRHLRTEKYIKGVRKDWEEIITLGESVCVFCMN